MSGPSGMVTASIGTDVLSAIIHLLGVTILAHLISRRAMLRGSLTLRDISWPRLCVLLIFVDSWLFIFSSGILVLGSGLEKNDVSCSMGILLCIIFYGSSKLLIYTFLSERVYVVWQTAPRPRRLQCKAYVACLIALSGYFGIVVILFCGRISYLAQDRHTCYIGLTKPASVALLTYDFFVNAFLTGMFLWPVTRSSFRNSRVKRLAIRTLWSALLALTTSCVNILILTLMHGRQLGWVCLGSCGTDVIVNALVIYWVTSASPDDYDRTPITPDFGIPPSKSEGPESSSVAQQRGSKILFKLGRSKQDSPTGITNMQITVTTEQVEDHGEVSANESECELQKVHSVSRTSSSEVGEENGSSDTL